MKRPIVVTLAGAKTPFPSGLREAISHGTRRFGKQGFARASSGSREFIRWTATERPGAGPATAARNERP
jgi:hypothetical protein